MSLSIGLLFCFHVFLPPVLLIFFFRVIGSIPVASSSLFPVIFIVIHCVRSLWNKLLTSSISPAILIPSICQSHRWSTRVFSSLLNRPGDSESDLVRPLEFRRQTSQVFSRSEGPLTVFTLSHTITVTHTVTVNSVRQNLRFESN